MLQDAAIRSALRLRAGVGLKSAHYGEVLETRPDIGFFEVRAENYMVEGGPVHHYLSRIRERYPLSFHGVALSIGADAPLDTRHLNALTHLLDRYQPQSFSEHLAWSTHGDIFLNDLLPLPYTDATLQRVCEHIDQVQSHLKRRMLLENPATYVEFAQSSMDEAAFITEVVRRTGCGLLLFCTTLLNPRLSEPSGLITWNGSDPALRFAVYRNNVAVSLIDALTDTFPVTQALVGEEFFRAMAHVFIRSNPIKTGVLAWVGTTFPDSIETFRPATALAYLADVARLEMLQVCAYHAADAPALALQALCLVLADPDALANLRLLLHPSVHLLESPYAVYSLWAAHQGVLSITSVNPEVAHRRWP